MKDGWHKIAGYDVLVEDGKITRGVKPSYTGCGEDTAYVYRWHREFNAWCNEIHITPDAFRAGVKRETIALK